MRRLIVCADGTWNRPEEADQIGVTSTNVEKIQHAIKAVDAKGISQIVYYHKGVGTGHVIDKLRGGALGKGLDRNIIECYQFLVNNYHDASDEIYFFGFSRGAYTVRSLAGLIRNSGLLKQEYVSMTKEAFSLYRDRDPAKHPKADAAAQFRKLYSHVGRASDGSPIDSTPIKCIGVWDTVGALGVPIGLFDAFNRRKYSFHDTSLSGRVENAFHALAIDERRKPFAPTLWEQPKEDADAQRNWLEQAWFTGVHSNIGGGYADAALSDITFHWMRDVVTSKTALDFNDFIVTQIMTPSYMGHVEDSMSPFYQALGPVERVLNEIKQRAANPNVLTQEYVHESAKHRYDESSTTSAPWAPDNFVAYTKGPEPIFMHTLIPPSIKPARPSYTVLPVA